MKRVSKSVTVSIKFMSILLFVIVLSYVSIGCSRKDNQSGVEAGSNQTKPSVTDRANGKQESSSQNQPVGGNPDISKAPEQESETVTPSMVKKDDTTSDTMGETLNNGGLYVKYGGNVYYRQYTTNSYLQTGIFGDYEPIPGSVKDMMQLSPEGVTAKSFTDKGNGRIFFYRDRMYLMKYKDNAFEPYIYSVNLDGMKEKELGKGTIEAFDEKSGTLVCNIVDDNNTYELSKIDAATGEGKKYDLNVPCVKFLALEEGVIYYLGEVNFESSQKGEVKLCSIAIDGTNEKLLADTKADLYEYPDREAEIPCIQFVGDTIYFSYGAYGGTGNFWQGGVIAKVQKDGSGFQELAGRTSGDDGMMGNADAEFYVVKEAGNEILYYNTFDGSDDGKSDSLNLKSGEVKETNFVVHQEGIPFEYQGGIDIYLNASSKMTVWIPKIDYRYLGKELEKEYNTINDIEKCDNWIYYRLEKNVEDPEASIGWRTGYRRVKTVVLRQELGGDKVEKLYEY